MRRITAIITLSGAALATLPLPAQEQPARPAANPQPAAEQELQADPANDLFQLALLSYREAAGQEDPKRQKETYLAAIRQFDRFHRTFPEHENALKSWYYSAVCYQKVGNQKGYRGCLAKVVSDWQTGPLVGAAAYQLAHEHYKAEQYGKAAPLYALAARESDNETYRQRARYSLALSYEKLGERDKLIAALQDVLDDADSPFRTTAERVLAHEYKKAGRKEEALTHFLNLAQTADEKTQADAVLQSALLAREVGKEKVARAYFERILSTPGLEEWRGEAQLALMSAASRAGENEAVAEYFAKGRYPLDKGPAAKRLQLAAKAFEVLGQRDRSTALFKELAKIAPNDTTAFEAGYVVVSRAFTTGSGDLVQEAQDFLTRFEKQHPDDPRIHNTRLILAEAHYRAKRYLPAAQAYESINLEHIAADNHAGLRYRLGNALLEAGEHARALAAFDEFVERHPDHPQASNAIVQRAETYMKTGRTTEAQGEFDRLIAQTTDPKLKEYGWAQKATLYKRDYERAAERKREKPEEEEASAAVTESLQKFAGVHARLLADFPARDSKQKAASEFWRGWALYRLDQFEDCLGPLKRAREADPGALGRETTLHLALANYQLQRRDDLQTELDALLKNYPNEPVPRPVFAWLGTSFASSKQYNEAWNYLKHAITPDKPTDTRVVVWRAAGRSALEAGAYERAVRPLEIILQVESNPYRKAETHYLLARTHLALKNPERARQAAESALELRPQGDLGSEARLLLGDIAMAQGDPNTAAQHYVRVVEFFSKDPATARKALRRAVSALELKGGEEALKSAERYRTRLKSIENEPASSPRD